MQASHRVPKLTRAAFCLIASTISTIDFDSLADRARVVANFTDAYAPQIQTSNQRDSSKPASRRAIGGQHDGKLKTDKLAVRVYAKHGDTCSIAPHCESVGCASGCKPNDLVLEPSE